MKHPEKRDVARMLDGLDPFDESDHRSLWHKATPLLMNILKVIPDDIKKMSDEELERTGQITEAERRLRHSFWYEYNFAIIDGHNIRLPHVFQGVCRKDYFHDIVLTSAIKMAYICTPPVSYKVAVEEMLDLATQQLRDILALPNTSIDKRGNVVVNNALVANKVKIFESLSGRVHGAVQKSIKLESESKMLNVNVHRSELPHQRDVVDIDGRHEKALLEDAETQRARQIDERIKELERMIEGRNGESSQEESDEEALP